MTIFEEKEKELIDLLDKVNYEYDKLTDKNQNKIDLILNMFKNDIIMNEDDIKNDPELLRYTAMYYSKFTDPKDHQNMIHYYSLAVNNDDVIAMNDLGCYYSEIEDIENMMKCYTMAIQRGYPCSMNNLGHYYEKIDDIETAYKYYSMACDHNYTNAMISMALYYFRKRDYDEGEKYLIRAVENNNSMAPFILATYYYRDNNFDEMKKYAHLGILKFNDVDCMEILAKCYLQTQEYESMLKYAMMAYDKQHAYSCSLIAYYYKLKDDIESMKNYYEEGISRGCTDCVYRLGLYYFDINDKENTYKYMMMGIDKEDVTCMMFMFEQCKDNNDPKIEDYFSYIEKTDESMLAIIIIDYITYYKENNMIDKYHDIICKYINNSECKLQLFTNEIYIILTNDDKLKTYFDYYKTKNITIYNDTCPVCLDVYTNEKTADTILLSCGHQFCLECIKEMVSKHDYECPLCKRFMC